MEYEISFAECEQLCLIYPECAWISWEELPEPTRKCYVLKGCPALVEVEKEFYISSQRECFENQ